MKKLFFVIAALVLAFSCSTTPLEDEKNTFTENSAVQENDSLNTINEFMDFFQRFQTEPYFQIERVKFPYYAEVWEMQSGEPETLKIFKEDWEFMPFRYEESFATRRMDAFTQQIKKYNDTVKLEIRGVNNGIAIDYNFNKINGSWFLTSEKDFSD